MARHERDYYPTPPWCTQLLLPLLQTRASDVLLEPCRGQDHIANELATLGLPIKWAELAMGRDYLDPQGRDHSADVIVTNPPFSLALEFIETMLTRDLAEDGTACALLRLSMLGSKTRAPFWRKHPPTHLLTLTPRPSFTGGATDNSEYAWFCWDYGNRIQAPPLYPLMKDDLNV